MFFPLISRNVLRKCQFSQCFRSLDGFYVHLVVFFLVFRLRMVCEKKRVVVLRVLSKLYPVH